MYSMCPVHFFTFFYLSFLTRTVWSGYSDLAEIALGKPTAQWPKSSFQLQPKTECVVLQPHTSGKASYYIDFRKVYPILFVKISGVSVTRVSKISVLVDGKVCTESFVVHDGENVVRCSNNTHGRLLTLETHDTITMCKIKSYTCKSGREAPKCDRDCRKGFYGLACTLPCRCKTDENCHPVTGHCHYGCYGFRNHKNHDCFYKALRYRPSGHFNNTAARARSLLVLPRQVIRYTRILNPKASHKAVTSPISKPFCIDLASTTRNTVVVQITYRSEILPHSFAITYSKFDVSTPYSIHISINGNSCNGLTSSHNLPLRKRHIFKCQRLGLKGEKVLITHTAHNILSNKTMKISVCGIEVLECSSGYYGPDCRWPCNCFNSKTCDPVTGDCPKGLCRRNAAGPNCAMLDISTRHKPGYHTGTGQDFWVPFSAPPDNSKVVPVTWWELQLDGVYYIQGVTLQLRQSSWMLTHQLAVYLKTTTKVEDRRRFEGLGCLKDLGRIQTTSISINCDGPALTVSVVSWGGYLSSLSELTRVKIWSCADGTFGPKCGNMCNCKSKGEVCNKVTGACSSGCAEGYSGKGCQNQCTKKTIDDQMCWNKCNCYGKGCGPGVVLCDDNCYSGWMGVACDVPCPRGLYGRGCSLVCGPCNPGPNNESCNQVTGACPFGCANNMTTGTCKLESGYRGADEAFSELREKSSHASSPGLLKLVVTIAVCFLLITIFVLGLLLCQFCFVRREEWMNSREMRQKSMDVNRTIMTQHRDFHEHFVQNKVFQCGRGDNRSKAKTTFNCFSKQRHPAAGHRRNTEKTDSLRCTPLENNTQISSDVKVADWILKEDFSVLIERRKKRLKSYTGDLLHMEESTYAIETIPVSKKEMDKLYDEVGRLAIP